MPIYIIKTLISSNKGTSRERDEQQIALLQALIINMADLQIGILTLVANPISFLQ